MNAEQIKDRLPSWPSAGGLERRLELMNAVRRRSVDDVRTTVLPRLEERDHLKVNLAAGDLEVTLLWLADAWKHIAALEAQLAACRREALEDAAKAVCEPCRNGGLPDKTCVALPIWKLIEKEAHGDSR